jgi:hypothetical protein
MLKRVTWASAGMVVGLGASKWIERQAKKRVRRYLPRGVPGDLRQAGRELRQAVVAASEEGRRAMHARELELRTQLRTPPRRHRT